MQNTNADNQRVLLDVNVTCPTRSHDSLWVFNILADWWLICSDFDLNCTFSYDKIIRPVRVNFRGVVRDSF